jgi:hypothetical protein
MICLTRRSLRTAKIAKRECVSSRPAKPFEDGFEIKVLRARAGCCPFSLLLCALRALCANQPSSFFLLRGLSGLSVRPNPASHTKMASVQSHAAREEPSHSPPCPREAYSQQARSDKRGRYTIRFWPVRTWGGTELRCRSEEPWPQLAVGSGNEPRCQTGNPLATSVPGRQSVHRE